MIPAADLNIILKANRERKKRVPQCFVQAEIAAIVFR